ncbi:MAG: DNA alkylation repair protein [Candidatus Nanoarchaeia archaeon]|nr:DNA alkylation repair protein [Candidatus Nanoarchaeia archaeon]
MINEIQSELEKYADEKTKIGAENYLKGSTNRGLKMAKVIEIYNNFKPRIKNLSQDEKVKLSIELLKSKYFEDKTIGIRILEHDSKVLDKRILNEFYELFDTYIYEWATCDVLSSKVISKIILNNKSAEQIMIKWSKSNKVWAKRASIIAFVNLAIKYDYDRIIIKIASNLIKNNFRFIQLAVGWCLRNLGQKNQELELNFIRNNYKYFSREGLRYATEKMKPELRAKVLKNEL